MHRLVAEVLRDDTPTELRPALRTAARRRLARGHPPVRDRPDAWPRYAQIYTHALATGLVEDDDPDSRHMILWLIRYLRERGDYPNSRGLAAEAHVRYRELLSEDHPDTLTAAHELAAVVQVQGDYPTARPMFDDVLAPAAADPRGGSPTRTSCARKPPWQTWTEPSSLAVGPCASPVLE
ncbi:tetratricopeptide repeat protein [Pseudofrankia sp. BMG5.37]|uniref:tetratricopeptide repeat protein n=1 Tax=Pseudofrankia sp. BMG5.37 TaxID=3050035 RepID=UPI002895B4F3|nr:tetratricopeptide repeat protein [Pseudofrankia sp. BMG5.37]MDT3445691.1 tetratricopeptide repeat protein [Pseudofrankia sp. BMG5.37]